MITLISQNDNFEVVTAQEYFSKLILSQNIFCWSVFFFWWLNFFSCEAIDVLAQESVTGNKIFSTPAEMGVPLELKCESKLSRMVADLPRAAGVFHKTPHREPLTSTAKPPDK